MEAAMRGKEFGSATAARSEDAERHDPLRIALRDARDAFDPHCAALEHRAATAPLIWYIEDTPDLILPAPRPAGDTRAL